MFVHEYRVEVKGHDSRARSEAQHDRESGALEVNVRDRPTLQQWKSLEIKSRL
jgi:hypothetical protein